MGLDGFWGALQCIVSSILALFITGISIRRVEKYTCAFDYPMKKKYPHSYVRQNKIVKYIRKLYKMDTDNTIHWVICCFHYLQLAAMIAPILVLILSLFVSQETAFCIYLLFSLGHLGVIGLNSKIFLCIQALRCEKIKKENPKYAKSDFYDPTG